MIAALIAGFSLGISLILPIGAQNAFVLRQGLRGEHVFVVCLSCALSDAILIAAGVLGLGILTAHIPPLGEILRYGGAVFLALYGAQRMWSAFRSTADLSDRGGEKISSTKVILVTLALTWLNPHVYLDTLLLMGSISAQYPGQALWFAIGGITASFVFFFCLGYGARLLRPIFAKPAAWRCLEFLIAIVMWTIAASLIFYH